jgi:hypothetical protein
MNASHASHLGPSNPHPITTRPGHPRRIFLLAVYAALAAQLAIWCTLAARVDLAAAFTQAHRGTEADVVVGGAIWLFQFTISTVLATIRYRRYDR